MTEIKLSKNDLISEPLKRRERIQKRIKDHEEVLKKNGFSQISQEKKNENLDRLTRKIGLIKD